MSAAVSTGSIFMGDRVMADAVGSDPDEVGPPVVVVADMLFASRVRGAAQAAGVGVATVGRADALARALKRGGARLVLLDLELRSGDAAAAIREVRSDPAHADLTIVAWASHTNGEVLKAAREAGADRVLARSAFVNVLPELLMAAAG